jgi:hypothetical protein
MFVNYPSNVVWDCLHIQSFCKNMPRHALQSPEALSLKVPNALPPPMELSKGKDGYSVLAVDKIPVKP